MGMAAAERLLAQILGGAAFTEPVIVPVTLIVRDSSGPPPARGAQPATRHATKTARRAGRIPGRVRDGDGASGTRERLARF